MTTWLAQQRDIQRVVDPGAGSGRFILAAAAALPRADLVAIETDPLAALMLRANASVNGWSNRLTVQVVDYREAVLSKCDGTTAFLGNPPYVRHHEIQETWKQWYTARFAALGIRASALAGLHVHFFLQTRCLAKPGDLGAFITSAEWLDVNYGSALRQLLLDELGVVSLHMLEPTVEAFPGTATTAAITCFKVGKSRGSLRLRSVADLSGLTALNKGARVARDELRLASRWSSAFRPRREALTGSIQVGDLFRVHRGQVTGANGIWIESERTSALPERVKLPAITKARELIAAGTRLRSVEGLRRIVDLPIELEEFDPNERRRIDAFLEWARDQGAHRGYIASHRKAWWSVGLREPAPILCTYMARRVPQFTLNDCNARHINIAHGLYPRSPIPAALLARLVDWLNANTMKNSGRTYAGGLTKFEPKEVERLRIPTLDSLASNAV